MKILSISLLLPSLILLSCGSNLSSNPNVGERDIMVSEIEIDTVRITPLAFSGKGFFRLFNDHLYFFDVIFLTVNEFDLNGNLINTYLGKGTKDTEIKDFLYGSFLKDGRLFFLGRSYNLFLYSSDFTKISDKVEINWNRKKEFYTRNDINKISTYSFNYGNGPYNGRSLPTYKEDKLLIPIWISPNVNPEINELLRLEWLI